MDKEDRNNDKICFRYVACRLPIFLETKSDKYDWGKSSNKSSDWINCKSFNTLILSVGSEEFKIVFIVILKLLVEIGYLTIVSMYLKIWVSK